MGQHLYVEEKKKKKKKEIIRRSEEYFSKSNDSLLPLDTTFHYLAYVARWSITTF
jgi:hypothetical protein